MDGEWYGGSGGRLGGKVADAGELTREIDRFFDLASSGGGLPLLEDLLRWLGLTRGDWEELREGGKSARARALRKTVLLTEQRFTSLILHAAVENPRLTTLAVFLTKQRCYGGYADRAGTGAKDGGELVVKLEGASEPFG